MMKITKIRSLFRVLGWGAAAASIVWGGLFYFRFHNPVVDAFHDIPAQIAALKAEAVTWQVVGFSTIAISVVLLALGYFGRSTNEKSILGEDAEKVEKENVVEGT